MIRRAALSLVDQALLSAVNFAVGLVLIRCATQEEYGLYTQLIGLQALFSVLHAGLFVSAFIAALPHLAGGERTRFRAGMARAEIGVTLASSVAVALITFGGSRLLGFPLTFAASGAAALALLALWWREFVRAGMYADLDAARVLRVDAAYVLLVVVSVGVLVVLGRVSAAAVLGCLAFAGIAVCGLTVARQARESRVDRGGMRGVLGSAWGSARWEVLISLITWGHAQTFVFFAALQGGLRAAASISAARLLVMPLALAWTSYANVLRPQASLLLAAHDAPARLRHLALRSAQFVLATSLVYALALKLALPWLDALLFEGEFAHVATLTYWWLAYFALTGMTTVATSLLRSAFEFRALFFVHAGCGALALLAFCTSLAFPTPVAFVISLAAVEAVLAALCWRQLRRLLAARAAGHASATQMGSLAAPAPKAVAR